MNAAQSARAAVVAVQPAIPTSTRIPARPTPPFGVSRTRLPFSVEWSAGLLDGEGCLHIAVQRYRNNRSNTYVARVYITQNNLELLEHFRDGVGIDAAIYKTKRTAGQNRQCYSLQYEGARAMALVALLLPHLIRKRAEALILQAYWIQGEVGTRYGRKGVPPAIAAIRHRMYLKMRSLK